MFGWLCCSWSSFLLVYSKANPSVLRRTLIPNLNLLVNCSFSNNPCQELCKPPCRPPLPLLPMVTTTPMTITASKPRGNRRRRTTGRRLPSPCRRRPCHTWQGGGTLSLPGLCRQSVRRWFPCHRHRRWGLGGGGGRGSCRDNYDMFCCGMWS